MHKTGNAAQVAVTDISARLYLNIHRGKSKVLKVNAISEALEKVESFAYHYSIVERRTEQMLMAVSGSERRGQLFNS